MCFKSKYTKLVEKNPRAKNNLPRYQAWVFAHIQLTPQEAAEYKDKPVVYDGEFGFFFEPNEYAAPHSDLNECKKY